MTVAPRVDPAISHDELARRLGESSLAVVNVLPRESFEEGRIPGSLSLPLAELPARARAMLPDRDGEIVLYCAAPT